MFTILPASMVAVATNHVAQSLERMRNGPPQRTNENGEVTLGELMTLPRRHWELNAAIRVFEGRIDNLCDSVSHMQSGEPCRENGCQCRAADLTTRVHPNG